LVEFHSVSGNFGYSAEAAARTSFYAFAGYPSLFRDGKDIWTGSSPGDWRDSITARVARSSPVTMTITGSYNASNNQGTVTVQVRNDSTATISNSKVYVCITEDSLYNVDPNGHAWHNHMFRDFLPDQNGDTLTVAPGQTKSVTKSFTINGAWNENRCAVAAWYQLSTGTKDAFQSGGRKVMSLVPIEEEEAYPEPPRALVTLKTNPCATSARFALNLPENESYTISVYNLTGGHVQTIHGTISAGQKTAVWNLCDGNGSRVSSGVYLYRLTSPSGQATGKIVVR
jgi:hypothetical protein